jgi:N-acetylmuramoyl-L-alanine amidase
MPRTLAGLLLALLASLAVVPAATAAKPATTKIGKAADDVKPGRAVVDHVGWEVVDGRPRLVIGVRGGVDYTTHTAGADGASNLPNRAYVDLHPAVLDKDIPRAPRSIDDAIARQLRVGQFDVDTVRIVIDLTEPALFEVRTSEHPPRLLLGLSARSAEAAARPAQAAAASAGQMSAPAQAPPVKVAQEAAQPSPPAPTRTAARTPEPSAAPTVPPTAQPTAQLTAAPTAAPTAPPPRVSMAAPAVAPLPPPAVAAAPERPPAVAAVPPPPVKEAPETRRATPPSEPGPRLAAGEGAAEQTPAPEPRRSGAGKDRGGVKQARPQPSPRVWTVVIDPGHGGKDPGAHGVTGDDEKDITLQLSQLVAEQLASDPQIRVVLTRTDDTYVSLEQRTAIANAQGADLFLSIHANASENPQLAGVETYTLNNTDDRATIRLAALENGLTLAGAAPGERDLAYILSDLVQTGKEDESVTLARAVQGSLVSYLRDRWRGVTNLGVKKGPFYVLVGAYMPCILVEVAFLTNESEGERIAARRYQLDVADGIAQGVRRFLASDNANSNL